MTVYIPNTCSDFFIKTLGGINGDGAFTKTYKEARALKLKKQGAFARGDPRTSKIIYKGGALRAALNPTPYIHRHETIRQ